MRATAVAAQQVRVAWAVASSTLAVAHPSLSHGSAIQHRLPAVIVHTPRCHAAPGLRHVDSVCALHVRCLHIICDDQGEQFGCGPMLQADVGGVAASGRTPQQRMPPAAVSVPPSAAVVTTATATPMCSLPAACCQQDSACHYTQGHIHALGRASGGLFCVC